MRFLGKLQGIGTLATAEGPIGPAEYELDGYLMRPGEVVASGELRMKSSGLQGRFDRRGLHLVTAEGRILSLRFTGKLSERDGRIAHIDVYQGLPAETEWRR